MNHDDLAILRFIAAGMTGEAPAITGEAIVARMEALQANGLIAWAEANGQPTLTDAGRAALEGEG